MKRLLLIPFILLATATACACGGYLDGWATRAIDPDPTKSSAAIARLRAAGPVGFDALLDAVGGWIRRYEAGEVFMGDDVNTWTRVTAALDAVARQKDAHASKLYWHTDLEAAKTASQQSGKPILSLRLLGNLDDELSCANSRFFRTVLYANAEVSRALREQFILHWSSERPVPVVTIDFGDGRTLKRTITGNSVHYLLDSDGSVVDAIPGLMAPAVFLAQLPLSAATPAFEAEEGRPGRLPWRMLAGDHVAAARRLTEQWEQAFGVLNLPENAAEQARVAQAEFVAAATTPHALDAARLAVSKRRVEQPTLAALAPRIEALEQMSANEVWPQLAALFRDVSRLDESSLRLMRSKCVEGEPFKQVVARFEESIAADTAFNQFVLHRRIHERLAAAQESVPFEAMNEWVYGELFRTPRSDPWLGLLPQATYAALPQGGVTSAR